MTSFDSILTMPARPPLGLVVAAGPSDLADWVAEQLRPAFGSVVTSSARVARLHLRDESPSLVAFAQQRPGELPRTLADKLRLEFSSARQVVVAGNWCEGELRTGEPWPEVERVYWYELSTWLRRLAVEDETPSMPQRLVEVVSPDIDTASALAAALESSGFIVQRRQRHRIEKIGALPDAALWIGGHLDGRSASELAAYCSEMRLCGAPVVAMLDFPRFDELRTAKLVGASMVVAKTCGDDSLAGLLRHLCSDRGERDAPPASVARRRAA